ncbi:hypothetical protein [Nocardia sp. CA-145437]|uniref:hypothetical protein n=1 Tax=Nocardia sp. CA-145437 TaxID=3239980 RepID=UPI003D99C022
MTHDHLLAAVLDVLAEVAPGTLFDGAEVLRAVRPAVDPVPDLDAVEQVLELLALPMLGGVVTAGDGVYRTGAPSEVVLARLRALAEAVSEVDADEVDDRY